MEVQQDSHATHIYSFLKAASTAVKGFIGQIFINFT